MAIDPICGMDVQEETAIKQEVGGQAFYFCSEYCKNKFLKQGQIEKKDQKKISASKSEGSAKTIYPCPMHPEIRQDHPGDCPKCGIHLEPLNPTGEVSEDQKETHTLSLKFWIGFGLTLPLVILIVAEMIPALHSSLSLSPQWNAWIQLALATPVVLWAGGMFFIKGWQSVINKSLNMFTLIALGVGAAYILNLELLRSLAVRCLGDEQYFSI